MFVIMERHFKNPRDIIVAHYDHLQQSSPWNKIQSSGALWAKTLLKISGLETLQVLSMLLYTMCKRCTYGIISVLKFF